MVKTVDIVGAEIKVEDLGGQNVAVKNLGSGSIYVSTQPNITAGADNVIEIPAGAGEVILDANGTVYIVGTGKVQCTGTPYATPNFKLPSSSSGGGGGTSDVTKEYVDAQDTTNLSIAKSYTDNAKAETEKTIGTIDDILNIHIANQEKHITAEERAAWNSKAELTDIPTELPANGGNADTATALTTSAGAAALPVYFSGGKPVACSSVVKYNTGNLSTGDNTISYATGYKYALILIYCYKALSSVSELTIQPVVLTWSGNLSSTTSYDVKTISQSNNGTYDVLLTVTNGDLIINVNGTSNYRYLVIWSN